MKSLKELFNIGKGPSSSHTMGPQRAARIFADRNNNAKRFETTLYGSLAATGKGHLTDKAIEEVLNEIAHVSIVWKPDEFLPFHPNAMKFIAFDHNDNVVDEWIVYSVGGAALSEGENDTGLFNNPDVYDMQNLSEIMQWCEKNGCGYWEYVAQCEDDDIWII